MLSWCEKVRLVLRLVVQRKVGYSSESVVWSCNSHSSLNNLIMHELSRCVAERSTWTTVKTLCSSIRSAESRFSPYWIKWRLIDVQSATNMKCVICQIGEQTLDKNIKATTRSPAKILASLCPKSERNKSFCSVYTMHILLITFSYSSRYLTFLQLW